MRLVIFWDNAREEQLAHNLAAVLKKLGAMLVHGKVQGEGVLFDDYASKPPVKLICDVRPTPDGGTLRDGALRAYREEQQQSRPVSFSYELSYSDGQYGPPVPVPNVLPFPAVYREFIESDWFAKMIKPTKMAKPAEPQPDTTTGVTIRELDIDHDH